MKNPLRDIEPIAGTSGERLWLLSLCFTLSGAAGLLYQTVWTRQFALFFGTSELATATVLAAYMAGLGIGAWLIERLLARIRQPLIAYAVLEGAIAVAAVTVVPLLLKAVAWLQLTALGGQPELPNSSQTAATVFHLATAFMTLLVPATLMGATLPLLARYCVRTPAQLGRRVSMIYAFNTFGAVIGALVTAFCLLPLLGIQKTLWSGAAINAITCVLAITLQRMQSGHSLAESLHRPVTDRQPGNAAKTLTTNEWVLPILLVSGAVCFIHEVFWTRILAHILGTSVYAFGTMVASFLLGVAIGGGASGWLNRNYKTSVAALAISQMLAAVCAAVTYLSLRFLVPQQTGLVSNALLSLLLLLPLTISIGLSFPLAVKVLAATVTDAAVASARVYYWNTAGAVVGAVAGGYWLLPLLRFEGTIRLLCLTSALLACACCWLLAHKEVRLRNAVTALALTGAIVFQPLPPELLLATSPLNLEARGRLLFYGVGQSSSVVVLSQQQQLALRTNGLPEALIDVVGAVPAFSGEYWLSPLAALAHPGRSNMLIVGYGGGVAIEAVPASIGHIDVIELEPEVILANKAIQQRRAHNPLVDPRVSIIINDARSSLILSAKRYDAIVSQPSHPWTAGASHLYTREFMQLAREHLSPRGVFVQWMNVAFLDESLLRSLSATMLSVFSQVQLFRPDPDTLVFLASDSRLILADDSTIAAKSLATADSHYARYGINSAEDLIVALAVDSADMRSLAADAPLITDDNNRIAFSSVFELGNGLSASAAGGLLAAYDPLRNAASWIYRDTGTRLSLDYIARQAAARVSVDRSSEARLNYMAEALGDTDRGAYLRYLLLAATSDVPRARQTLAVSMQRFPDSNLLRCEYLRPWLGAVANGQAPADVMREAARLTGLEALVTHIGGIAAHGQWTEVAAADAQLAMIPWTSPFALEALELRAEWRLHIADVLQRRQLAMAALALVDRAAATHANQPLLSLRVRAAVASGDVATAVESISALAELTILQPGDRSSESTTRSVAMLRELSRMLRQYQANPAIDAERLQEVQQRVVVIERELTDSS
jgi:spermidine synthase